MRVLLLSDTHGVLDPRIAERSRACDLVVHAGDVGSAAVLASLRALCPQVLAVRGNNDVAGKWPPGSGDALAALNERLDLDLPGGRLVVVHGDRFAAARRHQKLREAFPAARAIGYGHSHRLVIDQDRLPWVLNPGAAGRARTFGGPSCLELLATGSMWQVRAHRYPA